MREDHISSAVAFLREPQVASAALAKKVEFLESKGLTPEEINEALKRVQEESGNSSSAGSSAGSSSSSVALPNEVVPPRPSYMTQAPPPVPQRDWKDYFVMATVSVGVAYGMYECARRYVLPMIMPPTPAALEADKEALEAEFERTEQLIKQLQEDTAEIKRQEEVRTSEFNRVMNETREVITNIKEQAEERKQESKLALSNVESLRDLLPRALKQHSETQAQAVVELQNELKSLKQLLSRRQTSITPPVPPASSVPSSLPGFPRKPRPEAAAEPLKQEPKIEPKPESKAEIKPDSKPEYQAQPEAQIQPQQPASQPAASNGSNDFIPDPQAGIPEWQRAATSS